jgi:phosphoglycerol transferase MdoB-like AlkP superfamily enzyme
MGLHDEYVLRFMLGELNRQQGPFFAVHYNTSTHYPNDLPATYREVYPKENRSDQMKSMSYYNRCLEEFFSNAALQPWFRHTVFLFCSDHWMFPDTKSPVSDVVQSFRIPIMLYDPEKQAGAVIREPVSQLDMLNTVLAIAGDRASYISYGENLLDTARLQNRVIISRENANLYQAFDRHFVLGFNPVNGKAEFLYDIRQDPGRVNNLVSVAMSDRNRLEKNIQAFLQRVSAQYTDPNWKR